MTGVVEAPPAGDAARFFRAWICDPFAISAVTPYGPSLARLMSAGIGPDTGPVVEFGPGTGVFTRAILRRGVAPANLLLIERSPVFTLLLRDRFPDLCVICDLAEGLATHARTWLAEPPGAVVSGLPLLAIPSSAQHMILDAAFSVLRPGGTFVQFTYGHVVPVARKVAKNLGLASRLVGRTLRNLPLASVYEISRGSG